MQTFLCRVFCISYYLVQYSRLTLSLWPSVFLLARISGSTETPCPPAGSRWSWSQSDTVWLPNTEQQESPAGRTNTTTGRPGTFSALKFPIFIFYELFKDSPWFGKGSLLLSFPFSWLTLPVCLWNNAIKQLPRSSSKISPADRKQ